MNVYEQNRLMRKVLERIVGPSRPLARQTLVNVGEEPVEDNSSASGGAIFARKLINSGAENYIGEVFDTERGDVEVTARYIKGKTPAEKLLVVLDDIAEACNCCGDRADLSAMAQAAVDEYERNTKKIDTGHCTIGDSCVCGGDLPAIRQGCSCWRGEA